ncbi:unnamed protein product [Acanthoscelides obtectus]|uniref:Uncharacterized protein n=1 Tax=Acanthoscelides obtectus TaxID=200917 RepID=A0A9P0PR03_ACAOB|nr:unnamed protein product [Acanthoscelides obtectus]CAK1650097.1 hypothetical protein AOBTE_LOCUS16597 [Acanthoscelides obtectus]
MVGPCPWPPNPPACWPQLPPGMPPIPPAPGMPPYWLFCPPPYSLAMIGLQILVSSFSLSSNSSFSAKLLLSSHLRQDSHSLSMVDLSSEDSLSPQSCTACLSWKM